MGCHWHLEDTDEIIEFLFSLQTRTKYTNDDIGESGFAVSNYSIPSYAAFNGIYPRRTILTPNPSAKPPVTNTNLPPTVQPYTGDEPDILNKEVDLHNNQRSPIEIDFSIIAERIEKIAILRL